MTVHDLLRLANENPHVTLSIRAADGIAVIVGEAEIDGRRAAFSRHVDINTASDCCVDVAGAEVRTVIDGLNSIPARMLAGFTTPKGPNHVDAET